MKKLSLIMAALCLSVALTVSASALEYTIAAPTGPEFGKATTIEPVVTADRGEQANVDVSKNAALIPPAFGLPADYALSGVTSVSAAAPVSSFTNLTSDLCYSDGSLGTLSIPRLGVNVKIFEGTDSASLAKGAGHFEGTSIWGGNCCFAAHNRGVNAYFGQIHTLNVGDTITLTTQLGTRTYAVTSVEKVLETDTSGLDASATDQITLYTCVRDQLSTPI